MIDTILDTCREVLEINGDPQNPYWLASQMMEMRLWRASEHDVRAALEKDISEFDERSPFVKADDDQWALRSWYMEEEAGD
jgi:DNA-directed RNA polymerase delta subunit